MKKSRIFPIASAVCAIAVLAACSRGASTPAFDGARIAADIQVLASDDFEGRAPATAGEVKTVDFLIKQLTAAGLQPGGDPQPDGSRAWTQDVPLLKAEISGPTKVQVVAGHNLLDWKQGEQIAIRAAQTGASDVKLAVAPLVFVGYGVTAPERDWNDYKDVDLKGKVALVLVNDPDFETGQGDFGGKAMTYYGRWTYKYEEAARRGAAGVLVIHETAPASYPWGVVGNSGSEPGFDVVRANPLEVHTPVEGWIQRDAVADLFTRVGLDFETLKKQAQTREFTPVTLPGVGFSTEFAVKNEQVVSKNVIGVLPGKTKPDEWLLYTGHWDHLGVIPGEGEDTIYNGAVDNASGTALLLELARGFAQAKPVARSIAFLFVTAEEKGLLGSEYYGANPVYPLAKTVANLNTDALGPGGAAKDFSTAGDAPSTLQDMLIEEAKKQGRYFTPDSKPEAGHFFRSDHFSFAKRGLPAISFGSGEDLVDGGIEAGKAAAEDYVEKRYHQASDEYDPGWNMQGMVTDANLLYALGHRLADSGEWPEWKQGAEFKAARDATAAERQ